jgi:hypothetical protein
MGAPALIVIPRAFFSCSLKGRGYSMAAMKSIKIAKGRFIELSAFSVG